MDLAVYRPNPAALMTGGSVLPVPPNRTLAHRCRWRRNTSSAGGSAAACPLRRPAPISAMRVRYLRPFHGWQDPDEPEAPIPSGPAGAQRCRSGGRQGPRVEKIQRNRNFFVQRMFVMAERMHQPGGRAFRAPKPPGVGLLGHARVTPTAWTSPPGRLQPASRAGPSGIGHAAIFERSRRAAPAQVRTADGRRQAPGCAARRQ